MNKSQITKEQIEKDIKKVAIQFKKDFPESKDHIGRDYYRAKGKHGSQVDRVFGSFKNAINEVFKQDKGITRSEINITKKFNNNNCKRYIISSIVIGQEINEEYMQSIFTYCKKRKAELILLVMRGVKNTDTLSLYNYEKYSKYFITDANINENLRIIDIELNPQSDVSIDPLFKIDPNRSILIAHTKQALTSIPNRIGEYPHLLYFTGCITKPNYSDNKQGRIAKQNHVQGGCIVEVLNNKKFHVRHFQCDNKNGFAEDGFYYKGNKVTKINSDIVLGDIHCGAESKVAIEQSKQMIKKYKCKKIYVNDLFDARSVSHHEDNDRYAQYNRPIHQQSLQNELDYLGNFLVNFYKGIEYSELIVVPSNHDYFVSKWLTEGRFVFDTIQNSKLGSELFSHYLDGENPIEYYLRSRGYLKNIKIKFATITEELNSYGYDIHHGHKGVNSPRGSIKSFDKCYGKNVSAHTHQPKKDKNSVTAGANCNLDQPYILGTGSSWVWSNVVLYENSTEQSIHIIEGKWRLE